MAVARMSAGRVSPTLRPNCDLELLEADMPLPGHKPLTNVGAQPRRSGVRNEAAALPAANRPSLSYYRPPRRRRDSAEAAILEGFTAEAAPMEALPDVAVASFGDITMLEAVIGNDDRVRVADQLLSANPWRQICALRIKSQTGKMYVGTGWFIAPSALATAGHCVYLQNEGGWAQSIDVIPAKRGSEEPFGRVTSQRFHAVDGWVNQQQRDFDYGVIRLADATLGGRLGNLEVRALSDSALGGVDAKISGYPADRDRAEFQYFHERPLMSSTPTRLMYDIDTFGGQSGSPIWQDTQEGGLVAIGVHTTGGLSSNSGTRINESVLDNFIQWIKDT